MHRCLITLTLITLAACSPSGDQQQSPDNAVRLLLPTEPAQPETPPVQPEGAAWSNLASDSVAFGLPGQPPLLTISCIHSPDGTPRLHFTRRTRAEAGAQALLAIEGNGHVARVAMDVVRAGDPGEWQGAIDAARETAEAIKGGAPMVATLPGGGALKLPPGPDAGRLLEACRASGRKAQPVGVTRTPL